MMLEKIPSRQGLSVLAVFNPTFANLFVIQWVYFIIYTIVFILKHYKLGSLNKQLLTQCFVPFFYFFFANKLGLIGIY